MRNALHLGIVFLGNRFFAKEDLSEGQSLHCKTYGR